MKTPKFWNSINPISLLLLPFSACYHLGCRMHHSTIKAQKLPVPIICVGNLTAGGAGKTPVALYIGEMLKQKKINAFFISRGYGGTAKNPTIVDIKKHSAKQVGDEPLLLARVLPTIVGSNRIATANLAVKAGAEVIVMDDGFQNPSVFKDLSLIVVDRRLSFGNEMLLPAGPLREPVSSGIKRADAVVIINPANFMPTSLPGIPFLLARSKAKPSMLALKDKKILAFCGIAHPEKFYKMLRDIGAEIVETISFADHHKYRENDLEYLVRRSEFHHVPLVTTSKDAVRLPDEFRKTVCVAEMELEFDNKEKLEALINDKIRKQ